jgi:outer membrane receptor protein involved in Fe transport
VDEDASPVGGARITVRAAGGTAAIQQKQADPTGAFVIDLPGPGDYRIDVEREGYYELKDYPLRVDASQEVTLAVNTIREVFQSININAEPSPVDLAQTQKEERLTGTEINDVPYANSHSLRNSMKLMPGVMEDPTGRLHFNGSSENQVLYVLNGFNITDPISGQFQTRLGVDGIRSLDFASGRYSPEFGKGSAGVLAINTNAGTDAFHYTATDFIPGLDIQQGVRLSNWYPRFGVSGPIVRGRAWFADNFESEYNQSFVNGLPSGQNTRTGWAGANLLHAQVNLTASNILFADFLVNIDNEGRSGLGVLDPVPTTSDLRRREYLGSIKDQVYFGHGALVEFGYAHSDFSDRQIPQGQNLYVFSPQGRSGNYFVNSSQTSSRDQGIVNAYLPAFHFAGTHQIKAGVDADRLQYDGQVARTGYDLIGVSGRLISRTLYSGSGLIHVPDIEQSTYLQDTWRVSERLQVDAGIRQDWDQRISDVAWSPRVAFSWSPFAAGRTRVSGGYTITHDAVNLELLGRPEDQAGFTTYFNADGSPGGSAAPTTFFLGEPLRLPRATNWTASIDHRLTDSITISANYFRRRLDEGFAYINTLDPSGPPSELPLPNSAAGGVYRLENLRRDNYDAEGVTVRQKLSAQYEWMASYVHSHAASNAVLDYNSADPLQVGPTLRPVPWDAPNRLLAWAYLPLPWKNWALPVLADARTGFPFSIQHDNGLISGPVDSHRYPLNFDLNIHLERTFTLRGYRFALRGGMNNVTNQKNPTAVNNVIGAASFLQFYGYEGRHFVARVRFFGRAK